MENHNMSKSRIYSVWRAMKKRCYREKDQEYKAYGSRGIQVCDEWKNSFLSFYNWSIENGYTEETMTNNRNRLTLDRINNDGNYEPSNCRWVTRVEQNNNTRKNRFITAFGETDTLSNMARKYGVNVDCLWSRLNAGWNVEKALSTKIQSRNFKKAKLEELGEKK